MSKYGLLKLHEDAFRHIPVSDFLFALRVSWSRIKQAYFLLGRAYSRVGRLDEAKAALKKLDELNRAEIPGQEKGSTGDANPKPDTP